MDMENFIAAFRDPAGSCMGECPCGKTFYNPDDSWTWEDGELAALENNPNAVGVDHAIGYISFEGQTFIDACDCWHPRAMRLMNFIDGHDRKIAAYLNTERERKIAEANSVPVIKDAI